MKGAKEYAKLLKTGQYGRLYVLSDRHARGLTFRIFVLPKGEKAVIKYKSNPPCNAVEVYGATNGQLGWTEEYGWLYWGKWQKDFMELIENARREQIIEGEKRKICITRKDKEKEKEKQLLLSTY